MTRDSKSRMATIHNKTVNLKKKTMSAHLTVADVLPSDWPKCQSERQGNCSDCETEWSEEEDSGWSDDVSEMTPENRELWESFLNNPDRHNPLHFTCLPNIMALDSGHADEEAEEEPMSASSQWKENIEWSTGEDSDWSDDDSEEMSSEDKELWESFFNNGDPNNPLHSTCPTEVKLKASDMQQNCTSSRPQPTASESEEDNPGRSKNEQVKKVTFREEVTIHTLEAWSVESQAARDGSCWMEMARDRDRFRNRVAKAEEILSQCLTAQHRATVLNRIMNHTDVK